MSTHSNEGDTSHVIPDWEHACKKAEARIEEREREQGRDHLAKQYEQLCKEAQNRRNERERQR